MQNALESALSDAVGATVTVRSLTGISGGSINEAAVAQTTAGPFFVKWNRHPIPDQFEREIEGLEALRAAGTSLRIPAPVACRRASGETPAFLVLEYLEPHRRAADFDQRLGTGLAALHRRRSEQFGFTHDNYCGTTPQPNPWTAAWIPFYRDHRLGHQVALLTEKGRLSSGERQTYDRLLERLDEYLACDDEPAALLHGDLWSGNVHSAHEGAPAILDPAAYYGHREAELGMMSLFGGFSQQVWNAYHDAYPLQPGWKERLPLYELYHVLNHANLFGGSYGAQALAIARRFTN